MQVVNLVTNRVARILGKVENTERFLRVALYQGIPKQVGVTAQLSAFAAHTTKLKAFSFVLSMGDFVSSSSLCLGTTEVNCVLSCCQLLLFFSVDSLTQMQTQMQGPLLLLYVAITSGVQQMHNI